MSEHQQHRSPASLSSLVTLCERIEAEAPALKVVAVYELPKPFIKVRDTVHGLVVALSSEAEFVLYMQIIHSRRGGRGHV